MSKLNIKKQLNLLYISNFLFNIPIAGAAWVLLLVSDGYSLIQVGIAETVFHIVSLLAEIPSGMFADVMGRKKSLIVSCFMTMLSAAVRGFIPGFGAVCVAVEKNKKELQTLLRSMEYQPEKGWKPEVSGVPLVVLGKQLF